MVPGNKHEHRAQKCILPNAGRIPKTAEQRENLKAETTEDSYSTVKNAAANGVVKFKILARVDLVATKEREAIYQTHSTEESW